MTAIPSLPAPLDAVPHQRDDWFAWRDDVTAYRVQMTALANDDPEARAVLLRQAQDDCAFFLAMFGWIFEPRLKGGRGGDAPYIPYAYQVDVIRWIDWCMEQEDANADGVISKCRDLGVSWIFCGWVLWKWLFTYPFNALLLSRKEELVDSPSPKSLFSKIDYLLTRLPQWMKPRGYNNKFRMRLLLLHPQNGNSIAGESTTTKSARGDRATMMLYDEAGFIPNFLHTWGSGANSTDHRFAVSTETLEEGPDFHDLWASTTGARRPAVMELDWDVSPVHDDAWYEAQRDRFADDEPGFQREILRIHSAGFGDWIYAESQRTTTGDYPYENGMPLYVTLDPGRRDQTAILWVAHDLERDRYRVVEAYTRNLQTAEFYATVLCGVPESGRTGFDYDHDAEEVMGFAASIDSATYNGDPNGAKKEITSGLSFYDIIAAKSRDLTGRAIVVRHSWDEASTRHIPRREALRWLLPRLDFNDAPRVRYALKCVQENRFQTVRQGHEGTSEGDKPVHDWTSHYVSALEFLAVNLQGRNRVRTRERASPIRNDIGGRRLTIPQQPRRPLAPPLRSIR